jgi:N-methylhydantoinase B
MSMTPIKGGDVLLHLLASGGGWGDPLERDPALVQRDVWDELLSVDGARQEYGVVIDAVTLQVDATATAALRQQQQRERDTALRGHGG